MSQEGNKFHVKEQNLCTTEAQSHGEELYDGIVFDRMDLGLYPNLVYRYFKFMSTIGQGEDTGFAMPCFSCFSVAPVASFAVKCL